MNLAEEDLWISALVFKKSLASFSDEESGDMSRNILLGIDQKDQLNLGDIKVENE